MGGGGRGAITLWEGGKGVIQIHIVSGYKANEYIAPNHTCHYLRQHDQPIFTDVSTDGFRGQYPSDIAIAVRCGK